MPRQWKPLKRHPGIYEYETKRGKNTEFAALIPILIINTALGANLVL